MAARPRSGRHTHRFGNGTYTGDWRHGNRHGQGTYTWDDGRRWVREAGGLVWERQETREGGLRGRRRHVTDGGGRGVGGGRYEGEYRDDKMHGQGTYTWVNGDRWVREVGGLGREREEERGRGVAGLEGGRGT